MVWNSDGCLERVKGYNIYYSAIGGERGYELIDFVTDVQYTHQGLSSFIGCYYITAVNHSNIESSVSTVQCNDNCPSYILPNVFTPNGDDWNDLFRPLDEYSDSENAQCPRFVNSVDISFYNRWGELVYSYKSSESNSIYINWDGRDSYGKKLESGIYFYSAVMESDVLQAEWMHETVNGWVNILY